MKRIIAFILGLIGLIWLNSLAAAEDFPKNKGNLRCSITVTEVNNEAGWRGR